MERMGGYIIEAWCFLHVLSNEQFLLQKIENKKIISIAWDLLQSYFIITMKTYDTGYISYHDWLQRKEGEEEVKSPTKKTPFY